MKITDVKVYPLKNPSTNLVGNCKIIFDDVFSIKCRIMSGRVGLFVSMPSEKGKDGKYYEHCFPITREFREYINQEVIREYNAVENIDYSMPPPPDDDLPF